MNSEPQDELARLRRENRELRESERRLTAANANLERRLVEKAAEPEMTEEAFRNNEMRFRDFAESSADWFWETDADLRFTYVSPNVERILGLPPEWNYGKAREDLLIVDYDHEVWEPHLRTLARRKPFRDFVYCRLGGDDTPKWVSISGKPIFGDDGAFLGYRGSGSDVTEPKTAEEALRVNEKLLRSIIDNTSSAIFLKDLEARYWLANKRFGEWYNLTPAEIVGKFSHDVFPREVAENFYAQDRNVIETGRSYEREVVVPFADGDLHTIHFNKFPVSSPSGEIIGIGVVGTDITDHKRAEEALQQAQKMEAVGQLTGGVAHDFNNLLGIIIGNLELLDEDFGHEAGIRKQIAPAFRAALRGAELTNRLLAFSRKQALRPVVLDLNYLISGMTDLLRRTLGETIDIQFIPAPNLWAAEIDSAQLETALLNLAINARHAMPAGGRLTIETSNIVLETEYTGQLDNVAPGPYAMVAVSDTGVGMPPTVLSQVFDPFFTTKDVGEGSGLGLSMVHGFVKQTGGHVTIYSEEGKGTTVKLYFKRSGADAATAPEENVTAVLTGSGEIVLVVEDDSELRELAVAAISGLGYRVLEASDGLSALTMLREQGPVALLFTDVVLPRGMNGAELAAAAVDLQQNLKVLYTSGYTENAIAKNGVLDAGVDLVAKPYRRADLAHRIHQALRGKE